VRLRQQGGTAAGAGDDYFELKHRHEDAARRKIQDLLDYIPDLRVTVHVKVAHAIVRTDEEKYDRANSVFTPTKEETHENESYAPSAPPEPGVVPNVVAPPGARGQRAHVDPPGRRRRGRGGGGRGRRAGRPAGR
jgi:hypothetical protein